jgi:hypothetical protein
VHGQCIVRRRAAVAAFHAFRRRRDKLALRPEDIPPVSAELSDGPESRPFRGSSDEERSSALRAPSRVLRDAVANATRRKERAMTKQSLHDDSPLWTARMPDGARSMLPPFAAVSQIGKGNHRDRTFVREVCA